jgi:hypothetical protein
MAGIGGYIVTGDLAGTIVVQLGAIPNVRLPRDSAATLSHPDDERLAATFCPDPSCIRKCSQKLWEEPMTQQDDKKPLEPKAQDQSHKPAKHIEETARLASSETAKDPSKVRRTED